MKKIKFLVIVISLLTFLSSCGTGKNFLSDINLFTIQDDKALGEKVANQIKSEPEKYPILDSARYATAYRYLYDIRDRILNSGKVEHKDDFLWQLRIIHDDKTLNAFCTPGGYIYVYTGLIKFLDSEAELAGVLAHEIGHADLRHSTRQMTQLYGVQTLLGIIAGDYTLLKNVTTQLVGLKFSRNHENEADKASVTYLCPTKYPADAAAKFFEKMEAQRKGANVPEWLSTHPSSEDRIEHFHTVATSLGCQGNNTFSSRYQQLKRALP